MSYFIMFTGRPDPKNTQSLFREHAINRSDVQKRRLHLTMPPP
ncbi:hypothetical protein BSI_31240 [Bacillus inaquosorum KCTC 13429]|uniref:Uncharacterized protein n=1 Tax=Bacillus inaquosorum KCTC 13429 TaxID=1236548 RepID=A0A9W5LG58_9BACI|nr:hypothetical protein BSI_31240 [Bacillus inaquosorum KCTC 13429]